MHAQHDDGCAHVHSGRQVSQCCTGLRLCQYAHMPSRQTCIRFVIYHGRTLLAASGITSAHISCTLCVAAAPAAASALSGCMPSDADARTDSISGVQPLRVPLCASALAIGSRSQDTVVAGLTLPWPAQILRRPGAHAICEFLDPGLKLHVMSLAHALRGRGKKRLKRLCQERAAAECTSIAGTGKALCGNTVAIKQHTSASLVRRWLIDKHHSTRDSMQASRLPEL